MSSDGSTNKTPGSNLPLLLLLGGFVLLGYGMLQNSEPNPELGTAENIAAMPQSWGWRNDGTGRFDKVNPPQSWSFVKNVKWRTPLDTWSNASPVLSAGQIFFCDEPNILVAANAKNGDILWRRSVSYIDALPQSEQAAARAELAQFDDMDKELNEARTVLAKRVHKLRREEVSNDEKTGIADQIEHLNNLKKKLTKAIRYRTPETNDIIGYTSSTPVSNGQAVYTLFANGVVAAFDLEGQRLWARWLGEPLTRKTGDHMNGYAYGSATSPLLLGNRLIVGFSNLMALDAKTGETLWSSDLYQDFGTPHYMRVQGVDLLALPDGSIVRVSDGLTLKEGLAYTWYIGPTGFEDKLFIMGSGSNEELLNNNKAKAVAYQLSFDKNGNLVTKELWSTEIHGDRFYATPLYYEGQLYNVSRLGVLVSIDARTGKLEYEEKLPVNGSQIFSSPSSAGGKIFINSETGVIFVIAHGPKYELLEQNELMPTRSSPFFSGDDIIIRATDGLYTITDLSKG